MRVGALGCASVHLHQRVARTAVEAQGALGSEHVTTGAGLALDSPPESRWLLRPSTVKTLCGSGPLADSRGVIEFVVSSPVARYLVRQPVGSEHEVDVVPGLRHDMVQSHDLVVSQPGSTQLFTVVNAARPALSEHDRAVIAQALAATRRPQVVFLIQTEPEETEVACDGAVDPAATAAAVGVVTRSDRAQNGRPLEVLVQGQRWQASTRRDGQNWHCRVAQPVEA